MQIWSSVSTKWKTAKNIHIITYVMFPPCEPSSWCALANDRTSERGCTLTWRKIERKKKSCGRKLLPSFWGRKQLSEICNFQSRLQKLMTSFVFVHFSLLFFPHTATFWGLLKPLLCNSRLKTAAIRWQLWAFHLCAISRRSEISVCLSKSLLCV